MHALKNFLSLIILSVLLLVPSLSTDVDLGFDSSAAKIFKRNQEEILKISVYQKDPINNNDTSLPEIKGKITILLGTSTSGKTNLIEKLIKENPHLHNYGIDEQVLSFIDKGLQRHAPYECRVISEVSNQCLTNLVEDNDILKFKPGIPPEKIVAAEKALEELKRINKNKGIIKKESYRWPVIVESVYKKIIKQSRRGESIIFDVVAPLSLDFFLTTYEFSTIQTHVITPIDIQLVFCPLATLSQRLLLRNKKAEEDGEFSNKRDPSLLGQYAALYRPKQYGYDIVLETLTREQVLTVFKEHFPDKAEKDEAKFLSSLGFTSRDIISLEMTCRIPYYTTLINNF